MRSHWRRKFMQFGLLPFLSIGLVLCLLAGSLGKGNDLEKPGWQLASRVAPPALLEQVVRENFSPDSAATAKSMKIWKIKPSKSKQTLYLLDSRVAKTATTQNNPFCGVAGCLFLGYAQASGNRYQRVLNTYLNPLLPPQIPLIQPTSELQSGLPCLRVNQLDQKQIRVFKLCANGTTYEVVESHLLPKVYD